MIFGPPRYVEDLIRELNCTNGVSSIDSSILGSFFTQIIQGKGFTHKQGALALKLAKKYQKQLIISCGHNIVNIIDDKKFEIPLREHQTISSKIRIVKDPSKYISVIFNYNEDIVKNIRKFKETNKNDSAEWNSDSKEWKFSLTEGSIAWLGNNLLPLNFEADSLFLEFYEKIQEILKNMDKFAPQLIIDHDQLKFVNVNSEVPQPKTNDILSALLLAKNYGIEVWDEKVEEFINSEKIGIFTKKFIRKEFGDNMVVKSTEHPIEDFSQLLQSVKSAMIVIPQDQELRYIQKWHQFLKSLNFSEKDMTVMFRTDNLKNSKGVVIRSEFNNYIKENKLNSPLDETIKFVFVSRRIKKPLLKSGKNFDIVISCDNLGDSQAIKKVLNEKYNAIIYKDLLKNNEAL